MKKSLVVFCVAIAIALIAYSQRTTIVSRLAERILEARMGADHVAGLEDGVAFSLPANTDEIIRTSEGL